MSPSLTLAALWVILAAILAILPARDNRWRRAWLLIGLGLPVLAWVFWQNGPWWGVAALAAGASILRWPLIRLWRWLRARLAG